MYWLWLPYVAILVGFTHQMAVHWIINPQYAYGWAVPLLSLILLQRRRLVQSALSAFPGKRPSSTEWAAIGVLLFAYLPLHLLRTANPDWRLLSFGVSLHAVALSLILFHMTGGGAAVRRGLLPVLFLLIAVPWPQGLETRLIQGLTDFNTAAAIETLGIVGVPAVQHGNVIEVSAGMVGVDEACSGIRSFQATLMVALFFGEFFRLTTACRACLVLGGIGFALLGNYLRTVLLAYVGATRGIDAIHGWHDPAGVTILLVSLCGTWALALKLGPREPEAPARDVSDLAEVPSALRVFSWRFSITMAAVYAVSLFLTEAWYRSHERSLPVVRKWSAQWPEENPTMSVRDLPSAAREMLIFDEGRTASWTTADGLECEGIFMRWRPGHAATQAAFVHTPAVCLTAAGMNFLSSTEGIAVPVGDIPLRFTSYVFETSGRKLYVFRCVDNDLSRHNSDDALSSDWNRWSRITAAMDGRRQRSDQRVLEIGIWGSDDFAEAERVLRQQLATLVAPHG